MKTAGICLSTIFLLLTGCVAASYEIKPARAGFVTFSIDQNREKPLADADFAGWVLAQANIMVGTAGKKSLMGFDVMKKAPVWWHDHDADVSAPLTAIDDSVVVSFRDGVVKRINASTGQVVWQIHIDTQSLRGVARHENSLFIMSASQQLYAVGWDKGNTVWVFDAGFPDGLNLQGASPPTVVNESVVAGLASGAIISVHLATGQLVWKVEADSADQRFHDVMGTIGVFGERLVVARYDGQVLGVEYGTRAVRKIWEEKLASITSTAKDQKDYFVGTHAGDVYLYDPVSGNRKWLARTAQSVSSILALETTVFVCGSNGRVNAIDRKTGDILWHDDLQARVMSVPMVFRDLVYIGTGYRNLYLYRTR